MYWILLDFMPFAWGVRRGAAIQGSWQPHVGECHSSCSSVSPCAGCPLHPCGSHFSPLWAAPEQARPAAAVGLEGLKGLLFSCAACLEQLCVLTEERLEAVAVTFLVKTLFTDKANQTWVCVGSPYLSALHPGCGDAACAAQVRASCVLPYELNAPCGLG